jgi:branched-chain amino acid transport system permease protein
VSTDLAIFIQTVLNGLMFGSLFGIIALGLSLTWGILRIANFAHLSFVLLASYISYTLSVDYGWDPLLTMIPIVPVMFVIGIVVQWVFMRFKVNTFTSLLLTFGLFIVLENVMTYVWTADTITSRRDIAREYTRGIRIPLAEPFDRFLVLPPDLIAFIAAIVMAGLIFFLLHYTRWGRAVRAMEQDPIMAQAYGVNYQRMALILSGIATATAGVAGVVVAIKMPLFPSLPLTWIGRVVAAVILGGLGNPIGAIVAAVGLVIIEGIWSIYQQPALAPLISFSILVAVLIFQPATLLNRWRESRKIQEAINKDKDL